MSPISTFHRSATDAKLAGVCGGAAARWGLDPVLVRVGLVLLALTGGVGIVLYLAGWLLLPVTGTGRATVDDLFGGAAARWPRELWVALVVVACIVSFGVFAAASPFGVVPALALLGLWWFGYHRPRARRARRAQRDDVRPSAAQPPVVLPPTSPASWSGPTTPFTQAAAAWRTRVQEVRSGVWSPAPAAPGGPPAPPSTWSPVPTGPVPTDPFPDTTADPFPDTTAVAAPTSAPVDPEEQARAAFLAEPDPVGLYVEPAPAPVPAVRRGSALAARRLRLTTLVVLGLTWLGLGIVDRTGSAVGLAVYAGSGLLVVALGLVAATRFGRARGLLPVGVLLAVAAVVVSGLGPAVDTSARTADGMFDHPVAYTSAATFPVDGDRLDTGDLQVDLTGVDLTADATYRAVVDTGRLAVRTPPGTGIALHYDVDTGDVQAYGSHLASGSELRADRVLVPAGPGQHTLTLDLTVDTGVVEVRS